LFVQWRKTAGALGGIAESVREVVEAAKGLCKPEQSSSGVIPAFALLLLNKIGLKKNGN
jgi:hypothetical protein